MSLSGDKGVAQFKKSVKMEHPSRQWYNDNGDVADANTDEDIFDQDCQA